MTVPTILLTGPLLIGALLNYMLFGIYVGQLYHYMSTFSKSDKKYIIALVYLVTFIEVLHVVLATDTTFENLVYRFGNRDAMFNSPWSGIGLPSLNGAVGACVQLFFAWRIYTLALGLAGRLFAGLIVLLALGQFAASLAISIQFALLGHNVSLLPSLNRTITTWLVGSFVCDLLITVGVVAGLLKRRGATSFKVSKSMINTLIFWTIENGAVTTACAMGELIGFQRFSENWVHMTFEFMLGRLYANVLLATLNGRESLRKKDMISVEPDMSMNFNTTRSKPSVFRPGGHFTGADAEKDYGSVQVNVTMSKEVRRNEDSMASSSGSQGDIEFAAKTEQSDISVEWRNV